MHALYLGLISGTSADAIDAALVSFEPSMQLHSTLAYPYPPELRARILRLAQGDGRIALDDLGELDGQIARTFAAAAKALLCKANLPASAVCAIGSHGQTLRHRPLLAQPYTLQLGDPNLIAEHTGITTVADFRRRDIAAGGQGAPLLPPFHAALLSQPGKTRVVLNLGGIANITVLADDAGRGVLGFDTGPANCLLDAWAERHLGTPCDHAGAFAASGTSNNALLQHLLTEPYFALSAPKSTGRETFHLAWLETQLQGSTWAPADVQATLVQLTAYSIATAIHANATNVSEVLVCGGGVHNGVLMRAIERELHPITTMSTAGYGIDPDFVEAMAFAWLARERLEHRPGNLPAVTGAMGWRVLGGIYSA